jgi:hypothetical protein
VYLVDEYELNNDETNYFLFSEPALKTLLKRTHWQLSDYICVPDSHFRGQDVDRDDRVFCLLKSSYGRVGEVELLKGWYEPEGSGWRWTQREFSLRLPHCAGKRVTITVELFIAAELTATIGAVILTLSLDGVQLPKAIYREPGAYTLVRRVDRPAESIGILECSLNGALTPDSNDARERGVVIETISAR